MHVPGPRPAPFAWGVAAVGLAVLLAGCSLVAAPSVRERVGLATPAAPPSSTPPTSSSSPGPTTTSPPPSAVPAVSSPFLGRSGTALVVHGAPYHAVGVDAYELATDYGQNVGCGGMLSDAALESSFATLPSGTLVRMWGFQGSMATNPATRTLNWAPLDRVVAAASRHGLRLIVSLTNQSGDCDDGHWKDVAWYEGGYRTLYPGDGTTILTMSYWDWVQQIVTRYRNSPAIGMWELVNEPEASTCAPGYSRGYCMGHLSCPDESVSAAALRSFYDTVGAEVKALDPNHLVESGSLGGDQCGWSGADAAYIDASPGIDVASYHDYTADEVITPELQDRIDESQALQKPLIVGELGVAAGGDGTACPTLAGRQTLVGTKVDAMLGGGASAVLFWDWVPNPATTCTYDIGAGDPVLGLLRASG